MALPKRVISGKILCALLLLLLTVTTIFPLENEAEPRIIMHASPNHPIAGTAWTLTLLIAHNEPDEVKVFAPHFTGPFLLDQVIKGPRFVNPATGQVSISHSAAAENNETPPLAAEVIFERWTIMEYRFMLNSPGTIAFDAFTVITPQWQAKTTPFDLIVRQSRNTGEIHNFRLLWEGAPASLKTGESAVFGLRITGRNSSNPSTEPAPPPAFFLPPVPPGHVLESLPLTPEEKPAGIVLRLRLIPLEEGPFVLDSRRLSHGGDVFEIPALRIPVIRPDAHAADKRQETPRQNSPLPPFPAVETVQQNHSGLYQKHMAECETMYAAARNLWEQGQLAGALAELRKNERDHPAGAFFAALRREAEHALSLTGTNNEKKSILSFFRKKSPCAVLRETVVRQIPDADGKAVSRFREGQPVLMETRHETWLKVITNDDKKISGWVPETSIIFY